MSPFEPDFTKHLTAPNNLSVQEAITFLELLGKLDRLTLAALSGFALGLAARPRHTIIPEDAVKYELKAKEAKP